MIRFLIETREGRHLLGIVLERKNMDLLRQGKPISFPMSVFTRADFNNTHVDSIVVCYFETQTEAMHELRKGGFITETTLVTDQHGHIVSQEPCQ